MSELVEDERGLFPGLNFFVQLSDIAKKTAADIRQFDRELRQPPSNKHRSSNAEDWSELHRRVNEVSSLHRTLDESISGQPLLSQSLDSFHDIYKWILSESDRVEKQLQQFGYKPNNPSIHKYDKPLTPAEDTQFGIKIDSSKSAELQKAELMQKKLQAQIEQQTQQLEALKKQQNAHHQPQQQRSPSQGQLSSVKSSMESNNGAYMNDHDLMDVDGDTDNEANPHPTNHRSTAVTAATEVVPLENSVVTANPPLDVTPSRPVPPKKKREKIIPPTPKTPGLEDFGLTGYENLFQVKKENPIDRYNRRAGVPQPKAVVSTTATDRVSPDETTPSSPSISPNLSDNTDDIDSQFDELQNRYKNYTKPTANNPNKYMSAKVEMTTAPITTPYKSGMRGGTATSTHDNLSSFTPMTPANTNLQSLSRTTPQVYPSNDPYSTQYNNIAAATPATVRSTLRSYGSTMKPSKSSSTTPVPPSKQPRSATSTIAPITQKEVDSMPSWITAQLGGLSDINGNVDKVNQYLRTNNGQITKLTFGEIVSNGNPMILLLTRTGRLKSEWCDGVSVYWAA